jgi:hypothetical protein
MRASSRVAIVVFSSSSRFGLSAVCCMILTLLCS